MSLFNREFLRQNASKLTLIATLSTASLAFAWWNYAPTPRIVPQIFPLITANDPDALRAALDKSPRAVREVNLDGSTALHVAAVIGNPDLTQLLLSRNADPNALNNRGESPLLSALQAPRGSADVVKHLLQAGADPALPLPGAGSVLHVAAKIRGLDPAAISLLIKNPAQLQLKNAEGRTPLEVARAANNTAFLNAANQLARN